MSRRHRRRSRLIPTSTSEMSLSARARPSRAQSADHLGVEAEAFPSGNGIPPSRFPPSIISGRRFSKAPQRTAAVEHFRRLFLCQILGRRQGAGGPPARRPLKADRAHQNHKGSSGSTSRGASLVHCAIPLTEASGTAGQEELKEPGRTTAHRRRRQRSRSRQLQPRHILLGTHSLRAFT